MIKPHLRSVNSNRADYFQEQLSSIPGTLQISPDAPPPKIVLIDYNEAKVTKVKIEKPEDCAPYLGVWQPSDTVGESMGEKSV